MVADPGPTRLRARVTTRTGRGDHRVPIATHNQRGLGTPGSAAPKAARISMPVMLRLVESSMSSRDLPKTDGAPTECRSWSRPQPALPSRTVREMIRQCWRPYPGLGPDDAFVMARQENLETIPPPQMVAGRFQSPRPHAGEVEGENPSRRHLTMKGVAGGPRELGRGGEASLGHISRPFRRSALLQEFPRGRPPAAPPKAPGLCSPVIFPWPHCSGDSFPPGRRSSRSRWFTVAAGAR